MKQQFKLLFISAILLAAVSFISAHDDDDGRDCPPGWKGHRCHVPICFGISANSQLACTGRGICLRPNYCKCFYADSDEECRPLCPTGFTGKGCVTPVCYGIPAFDPLVCGGHGTCTAPDTCVCAAGWTGPHCTVPVAPPKNMCFGISEDDPNVCSGHGRCIATDTCSCNAGWAGARCEVRICGAGFTGPNCDVPICFSLPATDSNVCSGHGQCVAPNQCQCRDGWFGDRCQNEVPRACNPGYTGADCNIPICFSQPANDANVCSGHGTCVAPDQCQCAQGWSGSQCNVRVCDAGFTGPDCNIPICFSQPANDANVCSGNGVCVGPNQCQCNQGWSGEQCNVRVCDAGYTGADCNIPICFSQPANDANVCSGHGTCVGPDQCQCNQGWSGAQCEVRVCDAGFTGPDCNIPICFSQPANDENVCCGHGVCVAPDQCQCSQGWVGEKCQEPEIKKCFGIPANDATVCNGHGNCTDTDTCECNVGWSGIACDIPICFTLAANDENVCSGHGTCVGPDQCQCAEGWSGDRCQTRQNRCDNTTCPTGEICCDDTLVGPLCYKEGEHTCTDVGFGRNRFCCCGTCFPCGDDLRCYNSKTHKCVNGLVVGL